MRSIFKLFIIGALLVGTTPLSAFAEPRANEKLREVIHDREKRGEFKPITKELAYDGISRTYQIYTPHSTNKKLFPLVLVLHGGGGNSKVAAKMTGFTQKAREEGFIVVYPNGSGKSKRIKTWDAWHCCGYAMENSTEDISFISVLIDHLIATEPVNPDQVFVTGGSNGGIMTHRVGVELSYKVAGIAPVISGLFGDQPASKSPVPALIINGYLDKSFPMMGGPTGGRFAHTWDGTELEPVKYQSAFWAENNSCKSEPKIKKVNKNIEKWIYECPKQSPVKHIIVKDNGHAWPGGKKGTSIADEPSTSMNATDEIWKFFSSLI